MKNKLHGFIYQTIAITLKTNLKNLYSRTLFQFNLLKFLLDLISVRILLFSLPPQKNRYGSI